MNRQEQARQHMFNSIIAREAALAEAAEVLGIRGVSGTLGADTNRRLDELPAADLELD